MATSRSLRPRTAMFTGAAALVSVLAVPAVSSAAVTTTNVDAPAPESVLEGNQFSFGVGAPSPGPPGSTVTVSGLAPGADPGDLVDVVCTVDVGDQTSAFPLAVDVPVGSDGRFSAEGAIPPFTCRVRALPAGLVDDGTGLTDLDLAAFTGPRVLGGSYALIGSPPASARAADPGPDAYIASRGQKKGFTLLLGVGGAEVLNGGGAFGAGGGVLTSGLVDDTEIRPVLGGVGLLVSYGTPSGPTTVDDTPLVVDGRPAAAALVVGDEQARVLSHELDPVTGDLRIVESAPVGVTPDDGGTDLEPSGITLERTYAQDHDGRLMTFRDAFRSTDGAAHRIEVRYGQANAGLGIGNPQTSSYRVPWKTGDAYVEPDEDDAEFGPAPAGPATIYVRTASGAVPSQRADDDPTGDDGAYAFDSAPTDGEFLNATSFVVRFVRDVPAGGSATVGHRYAQAPTLSEVDALLADEPITPGDGGDPLPAATPLPQAPPVVPPVAIPGLPVVKSPLPRIASSTKKLLLTRAQGARLRDRKPVTVKVTGVPAGRYGITVQRFVRNGKVLARGTKPLAKDGDLAVTLRLTAYGREYFGLKRTRERVSVRTLVKVTWTPPGKGRKSRTGVFTTRFR